MGHFEISYRDFISQEDFSIYLMGFNLIFINKKHFLQREKKLKLDMNCFAFFNFTLIHKDSLNLTLYVL